MKQEINIRLNANRAKAVHTGHKFASGDKGIVFRIAVDELDTTGTTAKIVFKRSNGTSVEAGITETEGIYSYTTLGNEFAVVGPVTADVKFYENEKRVSTCTFVFDVTSDTLDGLGNGAAGYSDTLERMKKSMEQAEADILAAKDELEKRAEEILQQMKETAENAEGDIEETEKKMADLSADLEALYQEYMAAFGNVGPFNPRGPYSGTETYTVRDMVSYNDASWICYRNCTGATPGEESDCWQKLSVAAEVDPEDFLKKTDVDTELNEGSENPIANKAVVKALASHTIPIYTVNNAEELSNLLAELHANAKDSSVYEAKLNVRFSDNILGTGGVWSLQGFRDDSLYGWQRFGNYNRATILKARVLNNGVWGDIQTFATLTDLSNYLPKTGGNINGHLRVKISTAETIVSAVANSKREVYQEIAPDGTYRFYDGTNKKGVFSSTPSGESTFNGTASGNLPLDGGGTVKTAYIAPITLENTNSDVSLTAYKGKGVLLGYLGMSALNKPCFQMADGTRKDLLHTGNKPTGSYTGNGDATSRTINTGGIGNVLYIWSENGNAIVMPTGGFVSSPNGGISRLASNEARFANGVLTLTTTNAVINANGTKTEYQTA